MIVYDKNGQAISLKDSSLGSGGEGSVHAVEGIPSRVAKLYSKDAESYREKIEAMVAVGPQVAANPHLAGTAWPEKALYEDCAATRFVGFLMRRVDSTLTIEKMHTYPVPKGMAVTQRDKVDFLVSLTKTVDALHGMGQVIGDFNGRNVIMERGGHKAVLVDVDSIGFCVGKRIYPCGVLLADVTAPEIARARCGTGQGSASPMSLISAETDNYALAVHIFRLLMNGAHPFSPAKDPSAGSRAVVAQNVLVASGRSPYFMEVDGIRRSPFAPRLEDFPPYLVEMFYRAFVVGAFVPSERPSATEWGRVLTRYRSELVCCSHNSAHWHWSGVAACPYCAADKRYLASLVASTPLSTASLRQAAPTFAPAANPAPAPATASGSAYIPDPHAPVGLTASGSPASTGSTAPQTAGASGTSGPMLKGLTLAQWAATIGIALGVFWLLGVATPVCAALGMGLGVGYPEFLQVGFALAAVAGVLTYNLCRHATEVTTGSYVLAGMSAMGGMAALAVAIAVFWIALGVLVIGALLSAD